VPNIDNHAGSAKDRRWRAVQMRNRTVVLEFDDDETRALARIPMEMLQSSYFLPVMPDIILSTFEPSSYYQYQLAAIISPAGDLKKSPGRYAAFIMVFGQWIRFHDTAVEAADKSATLQESLLETEGSASTGNIPLCVASNWTNALVNSSVIKTCRFHHQSFTPS
jgi:hypothetical protein